MHPSPLLPQSNHNRSGHKIFPNACSWHCSFFHRSWGQFPGCFLHGSWGPVPGCFSFFTSIWHVFNQTFYSPPGWEPARVSSSLLLNLLLTPIALSPSLASIESLFRAPSTRCRMLLSHCYEPSALTPTAVYDELLVATVLMTPRATSHPPWHRRHGFPASLPASPCP